MRSRRHPTTRTLAVALVLAVITPLAGLAALSASEAPGRLVTSAEQRLTRQEREQLLELRSAIESAPGEAEAIVLQRKVEARKLAMEAELLRAQAGRARTRGNDEIALHIEERLGELESLMDRIDPAGALGRREGEDSHER